MYTRPMNQDKPYQVFGRKGCAETRKARRWFSDRGRTIHFVDVDTKPPSPGEWQVLFRDISPEDLIDTAGKAYRKKGMAWMDYDAAEELLENPQLMKTPVVRRAARSVCGYHPGIWENWD